jgi:3-mercaptopyruvate sulfurtransferase SseA
MDKGLRNIRPLEGGLEAWIEAGGEIALFEIEAPSENA